MSAILISILNLNSCIIESYPYLDFLKPIDFKSTILFNERNINSSVFIDEDNNLSIALNCLESKGDTIDYYMLLFSLSNFSEDQMTLKMSNIELYNKDFILKPDEFTERKMLVGAYPSINTQAKDITINANDSIRYFIRFLYDEENKSYKDKLSHRKANIVVTNILLEKRNIEVKIPEFYFK